MRRAGSPATWAFGTPIWRRRWTRFPSSSLRSIAVRRPCSPSACACRFWVIASSGIRCAAAWGRCFATRHRYLLGALFADTQCGAKLFRATPEVFALFAQPFHSHWIFDVEILARLLSLRYHESPTPLDDCLYELPLDRWQDVAGSKLKSTDFLKAFVELTAIWWHYLRPAHRRSRCRQLRPASTRMPQAIHDAARPESMPGFFAALGDRRLSRQHKYGAAARKFRPAIHDHNLRRQLRLQPCKMFGRGHHKRIA